MTKNLILITPNLRRNFQNIFFFLWKTLCSISVPYLTLLATVVLVIAVELRGK